MTALNTKKKKVAFIGSYLPRKCGIDTFASDLINNMKLAAGQEFEPQVLAMQSAKELQYRKPAKLTIHKNIKYDYIRAADYINSNDDIYIVSLQHEFGLFGGAGGSYLNLLLERLNKPVITTLHTILRNPTIDYFDSLTNVCSASQKIIVMNKRGIRMLQDIYDVTPFNIELIPHGIPDLPFTENGHYKRILGMAGRKTILTFGLLNKIRVLRLCSWLYQQ